MRAIADVLYASVKGYVTVRVYTPRGPNPELVAVTQACDLSYL